MFFIVIKILISLIKKLSLYNPNIKFKIEPYTISNSPDAIKLLKSMINGNLFFTENELEKRINHFNYTMIRHIVKKSMLRAPNRWRQGQ